MIFETNPFESVSFSTQPTTNSHQDHRRPVNNAAEAFADIVHNVMSMRSDLISRFMDPRRDYDKECGYPELRSVTKEDYKKVYEGDPIAARVVDCLPDECWKVQPSIYEDEDAETVTQFEEDWDNLSRNLRGNSKYQDEQGSPIWEYLNRADRLCGIGSFGIILLGLSDVKSPEDLRNPAPNFKYTDEDPFSQREDSQTEDFSGEEVVEETNDAEEETVDGENRVKLLFLRVFDESLVAIESYESNMASPRYGQPKFYNVQLTNPDDQLKGGTGMNNVTAQVHWSRVIHIAENLISSEIFAEPRMKGVYKRIIDLTKLYGGSAEMYWKGAFPGMALTIDPKMGGDVGVDAASIREAMWNYQNSLQRWFALAGVSATTLSPQVSDPTSQINIHLEAICIRLAIPKRIFLGSERGELASSQDAGTWNSRLKHRQQTFITPKIIIPFVDRLIKVGVLSEPEGFSVSWPDLESMSPAEVATVANTIMTAISTYIAGGGETMMEPMDFYTRILKMSEEEATAILDNRSRSLEEKKADEQEAADLAQLQELESSTEDPPEGEEETEPNPSPEPPKPTQNQRKKRTKGFTQNSSRKALAAAIREEALKQFLANS